MTLAEARRGVTTLTLRPRRCPCCAGSGVAAFLFPRVVNLSQRRVPDAQMPERLDGHELRLECRRRSCRYSESYGVEKPADRRRS